MKNINNQESYNNIKLYLKKNNNIKNNIGIIKKDEDWKFRFRFQAPIRIFYRERDILNLGANLREPFWQMRVPMMPRYDYRSYMENRSVSYRFIGDNELTRDYPTVSLPILPTENDYCCNKDGSSTFQ